MASPNPGARSPDSDWVYRNVPPSTTIPPNTNPQWLATTGSANMRDYAMVNWFKVDLDGGLKSLGFWNQVSGLSVQWNMLEYRVGDQGNDRWYFPGVTTYSNIVLKRAACKDSQLVKKWLDKSSFKNFTPVNALITLYAVETPDNPGIRNAAMNSPDNVKPTRPPVMAWPIRRMMPLKWNIDGFDAGGNKVAIETLEFTHEGFLDDDHRPSGR